MCAKKIRSFSGLGFQISFNDFQFGGGKGLPDASSRGNVVVQGIQQVAEFVPLGPACGIDLRRRDFVEFRKGVFPNLPAESVRNPYAAPRKGVPHLDRPALCDGLVVAVAFVALVQAHDFPSVIDFLAVRTGVVDDGHLVAELVDGVEHPEIGEQLFVEVPGIGGAFVFIEIARRKIVAEFVHQPEAPVAPRDVLRQGGGDVVPVPLDGVARVGPGIDGGGTDRYAFAVVGTVSPEEFHIFPVDAVQPSEPGVDLLLGDGGVVDIFLLEQEPDMLAGGDVHPLVVPDGDIIEDGGTLRVSRAAAQADADECFGRYRLKFEPNFLPVIGGVIDTFRGFGPDGGVEMDGDVRTDAAASAVRGTAHVFGLDLSRHHIGRIGHETGDDLRDALVGEVIRRGNTEPF